MFCSFRTLAHPVAETASLLSLVALCAFVACTTACGGDDASDTERRAASDATSSPFADAIAREGADEGDDDETREDADETGDDDDGIDDDSAPITPSAPSYEELLEDALTRTQVFRCTLEGVTFWLDLSPSGDALAYGDDWQDPGNWTRDGEVLTLSFAEYTTVNDPSSTLVYAGYILTLEAGALSCAMSHAVDQDLMAGSFAHCAYDGFEETWLEWYADGRLREYTETNITVDTLMETYWGASFFVDDVLALWLPGHDDARLRHARLYDDGIAILDASGNETRWCAFE